MKKYLLLLVLFLSFQGFSQDLNRYQYALVSAKFEFQKEPDQFRLNTLTKLLMAKYGFTAYLTTDVQPLEIANANCNKIFVDVLEGGTMFTTKLKVVLKDCQNNILFTSNEGASREKNRGAAYDESLRKAFESFEKLNHKYNGEIIKQEPVVPTEKVVAPKETVVLKEDFETQKPAETSEVFFFAQPTSNGFQVVNSEPKVIMRLFNTSQKDVFIAKREATQGVVIFKNNQWFFEYYENTKLISELIKLKF
jgi:hypothetical protein